MRGFFWQHCSGYDNPPADAYYTQDAVFGFNDSPIKQILDLSVKYVEDGFILVGTHTHRDCAGPDIRTLYTLGKFNHTLRHEYAVDNIKEYAKFIYAHFMGKGMGTLHGLPSVEVVDSWEDIV